MLSIFKKKYIPLNSIEVSQKNLLHNYNYLKNEYTTAIAPVLKSNAYGHGIVQIAKILDGVGAPFFCVDSIYEGYQLLKAKIKTPILIMGYIDPENLRVKKLPFSYAVYTEEMLYAVKKYQPHARIHIFVDTGMHREGVLLKDLPEFIKITKSMNLKIEGLMSHFAMGDKPLDKKTRLQIDSFQKAKEILRNGKIIPRYIHMFATSSLLYAQDYPKTFSPVARVGIGLYGIAPDGENKKLLPVLSLTSTIIQIKKIKKGEKVGYDFTYTAKKNMTVGVLPIGYNDGINRKLSNKGLVKINDVFCPIIGRISMNITLIDVTGVKKVHIGKRVVIYSSNPYDTNSIAHVSTLCGIIPYEILVQLHPSTKRLIV